MCLYCQGHRTPQANLAANPGPSLPRAASPVPAAEALAVPFPAHRGSRAVSALPAGAAAAAAVGAPDGTVSTGPAFAVGPALVAAAPGDRGNVLEDGGVYGESHIHVRPADAGVLDEKKLWCSPEIHVRMPCRPGNIAYIGSVRAL